MDDNIHNMKNIGTEPEEQNKVVNKNAGKDSDKQGKETKKNRMAISKAALLVIAFCAIGGCLIVLLTGGLRRSKGNRSKNVNVKDEAKQSESNDSIIINNMEYDADELIVDLEVKFDNDVDLEKLDKNIKEYMESMKYNYTTSSKRWAFHPDEYYKVVYDSESECFTEFGEPKFNEIKGIYASASIDREQTNSFIIEGIDYKIEDGKLDLKLSIFNVDEKINWSIKPDNKLPGMASPNDGAVKKIDDNEYSEIEVAADKESVEAGRVKEDLDKATKKEKSNNIEIVLVFGDPVNKKLLVKADILDELERSGNKRTEKIPINLYAETELYGMRAWVDINRYHVGTNGIRFYGRAKSNIFQYDYPSPEMRKDNICGFSSNINLRAWDDRGNSYLINESSLSDEYLRYYGGDYVADNTRDYFDESGGIVMFSLGDGLFKMQNGFLQNWDPEMKKIAVVLEEETYVQHGDDYIVAQSQVEEPIYRNLTEPIVFDAKTGEILEGEILEDPGRPSYVYNNEAALADEEGLDNDIFEKWSKYIMKEKVFHCNAIDEGIAYNILTEKADCNADVELNNLSFVGSYISEATVDKVTDTNVSDISGNIRVGFTLKFKKGTDLTKVLSGLEERYKNNHNWIEQYDRKEFLYPMTNTEGICAKAYYSDYYFMPCKGVNYRVDGNSIYLEMDIHTEITPGELYEKSHYLVIRLGVAGDSLEEYNLVLSIPQKFYDEYLKTE